MNRHQRRGLTVLELMVALTVVALLLALTIPAVMYARERQRQVQCRANLRSLGQAIHSYEAARHVFPSALRATQLQPFGTRAMYAPHVHLLPYMDQGPLAQQIDLDAPQQHTSDITRLPPEGRVVVPVFLCPSDGVRFGTNYRVSLGPGPGPFPGSSPDGTSGAFSALFELTPQEFRDGLSQTIAMSEKLKSLRAGRYSRREDFWYSGLSELGSRNMTREEVVRVCDSLSGEPPRYGSHAGHTWYLASYDYTWYNHAVGPNSRVPDCTENMWTPPPGIRSFFGVFKASSRHHGGVHSLFMDGAVRFMSNQIDLAVWQALSTRDGADPVALEGI